MVLHQQELCDLYRSVGVVRVVKCGRLRWAGYVARMVLHQDELCDIHRSVGIVRVVKRGRS
jgi:hypothetical protein